MNNIEELRLSTGHVLDLYLDVHEDDGWVWASSLSFTNQYAKIEYHFEIID